jgi:P27 family predicted phage terminase small subunit
LDRGKAGVTGKRGPVTGSKFGRAPGPKADPERQALVTMKAANASAKAPATRASARAAILPATAGPPAAPEHLGPVGRAVWTAVWAALPILSPQLDGHTVCRYAEASDDASAARAEIETHGVVLTEIIADPRGGVLGHKSVSNPALAALRHSDKVLTELADRLGLSPASRARLGLVISQTELAAAEASSILGRMWAPGTIDIDE